MEAFGILRGFPVPASAKAAPRMACHTFEASLLLLRGKAHSQASWLAPGPCCLIGSSEKTVSLLTTSSSNGMEAFSSLIYQTFIVTRQTTELLIGRPHRKN